MVHHPILLGTGVIILMAACCWLLVRDNRVKNDRIESGTPFVAYGSMKNWYRKSSNPVFKLARKVFGSTDPDGTARLAQLEGALDYVKASPLFQRDASAFQIFEIGDPARLAIVEFVLRVLGFDATDSLIRLNRTLRPGDITELRHRAYQVRSLIVAGPINCRHQWQPRQLTHNVDLTEEEFDRLVAMLATDRTFVMLCIKYADFLNDLVTSALDMMHTENARTPSPLIPRQTQIGVFIDLKKEFYPELVNN